MRKTLRQQQPYRERITGDKTLLKLHPTIRHSGKMKYEPCYHTLVDNYVEGESQIVTPDAAYLYQSIRRHGTEGAMFTVEEYAKRLRWSQHYLIDCIDMLTDAGLLRRERIEGYPFGGAPYDLITIDPLQGPEFDKAKEELLARVHVCYITGEARTNTDERSPAKYQKYRNFVVGHTAYNRATKGKHWCDHTRRWADIVAILTKKIAKEVHQLVLYITNKDPEIEEAKFIELFNALYNARGFKATYLAERTAVEWKRKLERGGLPELDALVYGS